MAKERIIVLDTNRSKYDIKEAADSSMTVAELIEELRYLPEDCKVVFRNDGGYTYGYVRDRYIDSEYWEPEEEGEEEVMEREDIERNLYNAVRKNNDKPVKLIAVVSDDVERMYLSVGYNDYREFGVFTDDGVFIPIEYLSDSEVEDIWSSIIF